MAPAHNMNEQQQHIDSFWRMRNFSNIPLSYIFFIIWPEKRRN